jgi:hypothetical protein
MPMEETYLNAISTYGGTLVKYLSLATGSLSSQELAVIRQPVTWGVPTQGGLPLAAPVVFSVPGGSTVNHVQYWSDLEGGTFYGSDPVVEDSFGSEGLYTFTEGQILHEPKPIIEV